MDSKFYVSSYAARLLKEKGYNEVTDYIIDEDNCMTGSRFLLNSELPEYVCSCPTKSEAIDWLESKGIVVWAEPTIDGWLYFMKSEQHYEDNAEPIFGTFKTRLEAEEAVIIKALELL